MLRGTRSRVRKQRSTRKQSTKSRNWRNGYTAVSYDRHRATTASFSTHQCHPSPANFDIDVLNTTHPRETTHVMCHPPGKGGGKKTFLAGPWKLTSRGEGWSCPPHPYNSQQSKASKRFKTSNKLPQFRSMSARLLACSTLRMMPIRGAARASGPRPGAIAYSSILCT